VGLEQGGDDLSLVLTPERQNTLFIRPDKARKADDVRRQNRGQPPFHQSPSVQPTAQIGVSIPKRERPSLNEKALHALTAVKTPPKSAIRPQGGFKTLKLPVRAADL
jgi:hypothetical protein